MKASEYTTEYFVSKNLEQEYLGLTKPINAKQPIVSVLVSTYNHEKYIEECLDSILSQKTNFPFEIILGEDESTDSTRDICIRYADKHPDIIRLFLRSEKDKIYVNGNKTGRLNNLLGLNASRGKYIAACEGDDYWIDENKLQLQFNLLENRDARIYKMCFHDAFMGKNLTNAIQIPSSEHKLPNEIDSNEIAKREWVSPTASLFFRNSIDELPIELFTKFHVGDIPLIYFLLGAKGKVIYIPEPLSFYRKHDAGISYDHYRANMAFVRSRYFMYLELNKYFNNKIDFSIQLDKYLELIIESYYRRFTKSIFRRIKKGAKLTMRGLVNRHIKKDLLN